MTRTRERLERLRARPLPEWWRAAKLGIFVHWTPASVPAFAPTAGHYGEMLAAGSKDAFQHSPYTEWYQNSLRFDGSPAALHHRQTYGDRPYASFGDDFRAGLDAWDPEAWARSFKEAGAAYVVLVAKHHDGFLLWPSEVANPELSGWGTGRDVVGELAAAVRSEGMRFGLYYSGGLDWTFDDRPMGSMGGVVAAIPRGAYPAYARAQVEELIERYEPSVLWNDIAWPEPLTELVDLFERYYAAVPDGVVNDRWMPWSPLLAMAKVGAGRRLIDMAISRQARKAGGMVPPRPPHCDVATPEYTTFDEIQSRPWECVRGMDHSFGHNAESGPGDFIARDELIWMLADIAAKGGNLLLNVGPRGVDAAIPGLQMERLRWLAEEQRLVDEALRGSSPWTAPGSSTAEGGRLRYVERGGQLIAMAEGGPAVTLPELGAARAARLLDGTELPVGMTGEGLQVELPATATITAVVLEGVEASLS